MQEERGANPEHLLSEEGQQRLAKVRRCSAGLDRTRSHMLCRCMLWADGEPIISDVRATHVLAARPCHCEASVEVFRRSGNTSPGPDGVPYAAWRDARARAGCTARRCHGAHSRSASVGMGPRAVAAAAGDLRALSNTDNTS